jgi:hypothetical protein
MPQRGERKTKDGVTGEWDGTTWRVVDAAPAASPTPTVGTRKTKDGITGEWDGQTWRVIAAPPPTPPPPPEPDGSMLASVADTVGDLGIGALKGAGHTVKTLADAARQYIPGVAALDRFGKVQVGETLEPANTTQRVGKVAEQIGEYMLPGGFTKAAVAEATPRVALMLGKAAPLVTQGLLTAATAAPVAFAHGEDPRTAALTGAAMPAAAAVAGGGLRLAGRRLVKLVTPTTAQAAKMVGGRGADKAGRVVDTILENRVWSAKNAGRQIGAIDEAVDAAMTGPVGDAAAPVGAHVTQGLDDTAAAFAKAVGSPRNKGLAGVAAERAALLGEGQPLATTVQTGMRLEPTGAVAANGQPLMRPVPVLERQFRATVPARDALEAARATSRARVKPMFGAPLSARDQASKAAELGIRDAVREAIPEKLASEMGRQSRLIDAQTVLGNALSGPSLLDAAGNKTGFLMKLLKANSVRGGVGLHAAADPVQRTLGSALLRALMAQQTSQDGGGQ